MKPHLLHRRRVSFKYKGSMCSSYIVLNSGAIRTTRYMNIVAVAVPVFTGRLSGLANSSQSNSSTNLNDLVEPFADLHKQSVG